MRGVMYKIEKDIKIEQRPISNGRECKYPFADMEVGDSFLADMKARTASRMYGVYHNKKFASRREGDKIRIFRIA